VPGESRRREECAGRWALPLTELSNGVIGKVPGYPDSVWRSADARGTQIAEYVARVVERMQAATRGTLWGGWRQGSHRAPMERGLGFGSDATRCGSPGWGLVAGRRPCRARVRVSFVCVARCHLSSRRSDMRRKCVVRRTRTGAGRRCGAAVETKTEVSQKGRLDLRNNDGASACDVRRADANFTSQSARCDRIKQGLAVFTSQYSAVHSGA
jgi:hypothetical protein